MATSFSEHCSFADLQIFDSKSHRTHDIHLLSADPNSEPRSLYVNAEYDSQNPYSIIPKRHLDGLNAKMEEFPQSIITTFQDRHRDFYVAQGTAKLRWFKRARPVTTKFYVVNMLGREYAASKIDIVLGGAEDVDGVIANLFDDSVPFSPIMAKRMTKEEKGKLEEKKKQKERERAQDIKKEEAAEKQKRGIERLERQQREQQQQQRPP